MIKYFLKVAGTTNVTQPFAHKTWRGDLLKGQASRRPPGRALAQQIQPQPCSSAASGPSPLPCFQAGEGKKNPRYLKLNAFSSKLFVSSCLGSWAKHECQCAEMVFPKDMFRSKQSTLWTRALLQKLLTSTWAIRQLAKLAGTSWKLYWRVWVTLCKYSTLLQLLCAPWVQLSPGDLHRPKVWHLIANSASAARGPRLPSLGGREAEVILFTPWVCWAHFAAGVDELLFSEQRRALFHKQTIWPF